MRSLDIVTLRILLTAIEEGSFAKAAMREHISVSAASRRISDLEVRLGVKLLHRYDRGVLPTAAAEMVVVRIRSILNLIDEMIDDLCDVREGARGVVRIRAHLTAIVGVLPSRIAAFRRLHPRIDVVVDEALSSDILHAVQVGDCDLGLVSGTVEAGALTLLPWSADELVAILPCGHPICGGEPLRFAELLDTPFIGMSEGSALQSLFREQAAALGRSLEERARVSTFDGVVAMVSAGLGVGIVPANAVRPSAVTEAFIVRPLNEPWAIRSLMICVRDRAQQSAACRHFLDHLLALR